MRQWQWAIAALALIALLLIAFAFKVYGQTQQQPTQLYEGVTFDASLLALDKRALDEAYHERMLRLFEVWLSSGAPPDAQNFKTGLRITRRAYAQARTQIETREHQLNALDQGQKP